MTPTQNNINTIRNGLVERSELTIGRYLADTAIDAIITDIIDGWEAVRPQPKTATYKESPVILNIRNTLKQFGIDSFQEEGDDDDPPPGPRSIKSMFDEFVGKFREKHEENEVLKGKLDEAAREIRSIKNLVLQASFEKAFDQIQLDPDFRKENGHYTDQDTCIAFEMYCRGFEEAKQSVN